VARGATAAIGEVVWEAEAEAEIPLSSPESAAKQRAKKLQQRMSSRHLDLLRDLSAKKKEKEEVQRREELRLSRRQSLLRDRLLSKGRTSSLPPLEPSRLPDDPAQPFDEEPREGERRPRRASVNEDVERRGQEAIRKVQEAQRSAKLKQEREELKKQWRAHRAKSYLLEGCTNPELKEFLEAKAKKPQALSKLPSLTGARMPASAGADDEGEDGGEAAAASKADSARTTACSEDLGVIGAAVSASAQKAKDKDTDKDKLALTVAVTVKGVNNFLGRLRMTRMRASCSTLSEWKQRNGCQQDQKVFICCGGYPDFKDAMLRRGWFENEDKDSRHFDLKWAMASMMDHGHVLDFQGVNHFDGNREITTKVGLTRHLRQAPWHAGLQSDEFYPRAFDLYDPLERAEFVLNFKNSKAESILNGFLEDVDGEVDVTFSADVVATANKVCMRLITDPEDLMDCGSMAEDLGTIPSADWEILSQVNLDDVTKKLEGGLSEDALDALIRKRTTRESADEQKRREVAEKEEAEKKGKKAKKKKKKQNEEPLEFSAPVKSFNNPKGQHLIQQVRSTLAEMKRNSRQYCINGRRNAWIVKPSGKSRGRGIQMMRELDEIFKVTESDGFQWICQKYIEKPNLVRGYKFDIRQWVLVTDWNPLTVYVWKQPYLRFAGQKYDDECVDRSEFVHLTNNSIMHDMEGFKDKNADLDSYGYMWFKQQYQEHLHSTYCKCEKHNTPWLIDPPFTCDSYGVRWEDVMFVAREEEDEDEEDQDDDGQDGAKTASRPAAAVASSSSSKGSTAASSAAPSAASTAPPSSDGASEGGSSSSASSRPASSDDREAAGGPGGGRRRPSRDAADGAGAAESAGSSPPTPSSSSSCPASKEEGAKAQSPRGGPKHVDDGTEPCQDIWEEIIMKQCKDAIINSLLCVQDEVKHRKNNFEMFGYDFMISEGPEHPEAWLIEVNSSPACDYSTPVTCPLVKKVMEDNVKVVVDKRENPDADTGEWELISHSYDKFVTQRVMAGPQVVVVGKEIVAPKGWVKKKKKKKKKKTGKETVGGSVAGDEEGDEDEDEESENDGEDEE